MGLGRGNSRKEGILRPWTTGVGWKPDENNAIHEIDNDWDDRGVIDLSGDWKVIDPPPLPIHDRDWKKRSRSEGTRDPEFPVKTKGPTPQRTRVGNFFGA